MIRLVELDLAASTELAPSLDPTWVLVRNGAAVLGEARFASIDPVTARRIREDLVAELAPQVAASMARTGVGPIGDVPSSIAVVVCTRDRTELLAGCLDALARLDPPAAEVLVVDNAPSSDATARLCDARRIERVVEAEAGLDRARNRGLRAVSSGVVAYVDDDARVDRHFVGALGRAFAPPEVAVVTGLVVAAELETYAQLVFERRLGGMRKGFERRLYRRGSQDVGLAVHRIGVGTNMAFRRDVLAALGGFDPRLDVGTRTRGGGDLDVLYRAMAAGHVVAYEPDVLVRHIHRVTRRALLDQLRDNGTAFDAYLRVRAGEGPEAAAAVRRYRRRWHGRAHLVEPARAVLRGELISLQAALAEARGSLGGRAALAAETRRGRSGDPPPPAAPGGGG